MQSFATELRACKFSDYSYHRLPPTVSHGVRRIWIIVQDAGHCRLAVVDGDNQVMGRRGQGRQTSNVAYSLD